MTNKNVPKLRFSKYNDEWIDMKIKDKFNFLHTNSFSRDKLSDTEGTVKNIHYGDIHTTYPTIVDVELEQIPFINASKVQNKDLDKYDFCKNGDLLIANASEDYEDIGKTIELIHITNSKVIGGLHTILLRDKTNDNALGFNGYYFQTKYFKKQIKIIANGVSVLGINKKDLKELTIKTPFKKEQENIASFLFNIDKKLKLLKNKKVGFIEFKHYLLQNLFPQNGETVPKLRFSRYNDEWQTKKLGELAEIIGGGTPSTKNNEYWNGPINWFTPSEITSKYCYDSERTITEEGLNNSSAKMLPINSILITTRATIGLISINKEECSTNQGFQSLILKNQNCEFVYYMLHDYINEMKKLAIGSTFLEISKKDLKKIKVYIPSIEEQEKIASFLSSVDKKIDLLDQEIEYVEEYKKGLLQKMFT